MFYLFESNCASHLISKQVLLYSSISGCFNLFSQIMSACYSFVSHSLLLLSLHFPIGSIFPLQCRLKSVISITSDSFLSSTISLSLILSSLVAFVHAFLLFYVIPWEWMFKIWISKISAIQVICYFYF